MAKLQQMGEFVRSASSTIEAPVVRRLKDEFAGQVAKAANGDGAAEGAGGQARCQWCERPGRYATEATAEPAEASRPATIEQLTSAEHQPHSGRVRPSRCRSRRIRASARRYRRPSPARAGHRSGCRRAWHAEPGTADRVRQSRAPRRVRRPRPTAAGPRPAAPPSPGQRHSPRPGPCPGNNPFSSTATGMGRRRVRRSRHSGSPGCCARQSQQRAWRPASGWPAAGVRPGPGGPGDAARPGGPRPGGPRPSPSSMPPRPVGGRGFGQGGPGGGAGGPRGGGYGGSAGPGAGPRPGGGRGGPAADRAVRAVAAPAALVALGPAWPRRGQVQVVVVAAAPQAHSAGQVADRRAAASRRSSGVKSSTTCRRRRSAACRSRAATVRSSGCPAVPR